MRTLRRPALLLVALVLAVGLSGCAELFGDVRVHPDDTADMRIELSVPESDAEGVRKLRESCVSEFAPKKIPYTASGRVGCRVEGRMNAAKMGNLGMAVVTDEGRQRFHFTPGDPSDELKLTSLDRFELRVAFRGKVLAHSGSSTVEGRTVVWRDPAELDKDLTAEAAAPGLLDRTPLEWAALGAGLLAVLAFVAVMLRDITTRPRLTHEHPWGGPLFGRRGR